MFSKKVRSEIENINTRIDMLFNTTKDFENTLSILENETEDLEKEYSSLRRIVQFHDHAKVTYANDPFSGCCYFYKDGMEYCIKGLRLRGKVSFYGQADSDFEYIIMAACNIDSNDEEAEHEEQYVIDLNARSFIRTK